MNIYISPFTYVCREEGRKLQNTHQNQHTNKTTSNDQTKHPHADRDLHTLSTLQRLRRRFFFLLDIIVVIDSGRSISPPGFLATDFIGRSGQAIISRVVSSVRPFFEREKNVNHLLPLPFSLLRYKLVSFFVLFFCGCPPTQKQVFFF